MRAVYTRPAPQTRLIDSPDARAHCRSVSAVNHRSCDHGVRCATSKRPRSPTQLEGKFKLCTAAALLLQRGMLAQPEAKCYIPKDVPIAGWQL